MERTVIGIPLRQTIATLLSRHRSPTATPSGTRITSSFAIAAATAHAMSDMARYRFFEWAGGERIDGLGIRITAGTDGAEIDVRDFYPLIENPHHLAW